MQNFICVDRNGKETILTKEIADFWFEHGLETIRNLKPDAFEIISKVNGGAHNGGFDIVSN